MSEADTVASVATPATVASLTADLAALGVARGMTILVHSALSKLGWVSGGAQAVVLALQAAVGPEGTVAMPTHSTYLSEPSQWKKPAVPESWWQTIRDTMPAFDPDLTPTRKMGTIPECFRRGRGVRRSDHPQVSFAAWGANAEVVTAAHALVFGQGEGSPLARLYELDARVLFLGVGHANNTSLHLSEHRAAPAVRATRRAGAPILVAGERRWVEYDEIVWNDTDFPACGADFTRDTGLVRAGRVAAAPALIMPMRPLVDYGVTWLERHRTA